MTEQKKNFRKIICSIAAVLGVGAVVLGSSYLVYRTTVTEGLSISEDGYIEIYTALDYQKFWILADDSFEPVNGRLMSDIYLNPVEDYSDWSSQPPENQCMEVYIFMGEFDGNGHTIYGLYSENGYGMVKRNRGDIHDVTIKKSLITGNRYVGGICSYNNSVIRNCRFEGRLKSNRIDADEKCKMAGISVVNDGRIETCGYKDAVMDVRLKWIRAGKRAGICTENYGEIVNCYNFVQEIKTKGGNCYAIADKGEENCYVIKGSKWQIPDNSQIWEIPPGQAQLITAYLNKDVYTLYQKKDAPENWYTKAKRNRKNPVAGLTTEPPGTDGQNLEGIMVKEALQDELLSAFIFEAFLRRDMDFDDLVIKETGSGTEGMLFDVQTGWKGKQLRVASCLWDGNINTNEISAYTYQKLWNDCGRMLGEENSESWQHDTWSILEKQPGNAIKGMLVLYSTRAGEQGFFYVTAGKIYRIEYDGIMEENQFLSIKDQIEEYAYKVMKEEDTEEIEETDEELLWEESSTEEIQYASLWEAMLWRIWEDNIPGDGFFWKNQNLRDAVYTQASIQASLNSEGKVLSKEELSKVESLEIHNAERIDTLEDLTYLESLKSLTIQDTEIGNAQHIEEMSQLTELYLINCGLSDISFVKNLTELTNASFYANEIQDISALACCRELEELSLGWCQIEDISALSSATKLKELGLQGNQISDIEALRNLKSLTGLNLMKNMVEDISPLEDLTGLTALGLGLNRIQDISALSNLRSLYNLSLDANEIQDVSALKNMPEMEWLGLSNNQIEDFTPIEGCKKLFYLSVGDNPGQNIGSLMFTPSLNIGATPGIDRTKQAQSFLYKTLPGQVIIAEDIARGDINQDGIEDVAVTGISGQEKDEEGTMVNWGERKVYVFLGDRAGNWQLTDTVETLGPDDGGFFGDPYQGIALMEKYLLVQNYGGSSFRWNATDIYQYENGELNQDYSLSLCNWTGNENGYDWYIDDQKRQIQQCYVIAGQLEKPVRKLLIWDENQSSSENAMKKEISDTVSVIEQEMGAELPEITDYFYKPDIDGNGYYMYNIHDTLYETKEEPEKVLEKVKTEYMDEAYAVPMTQYTTKEIKENYDILSGVILPDVFYLGFTEETPQILYYRECIETAEDGYIHVVTIREPTDDNEWWLDMTTVYYYENTGEFGDRPSPLMNNKIHSFDE